MYAPVQGMGGKAEKQVKNAPLVSSKYAPVEGMGMAATGGVAEFSKYLYNKLLTGTGSVVAGATDFITQAAPSYVPKEATAIAIRNSVTPYLRKIIGETIGAEQSKEQKKLYDDDFVIGSIGGLAESVPAMLIPGGIGLFAQGYDSGLQSINNSKFANDLSETEKSMFALSVGGVNSMLEKYGLDKVFSKSKAFNAFSDKLTGLIIDRLASQGKKITAKLISQEASNVINTISKKAIKSGIRITDAALIEGLTGGSQEAATIGLEEALNKYKGKAIFDNGSMGSMMGRVIKAAGQEAIGGGFMGGFASVISGDLTDKRTLASVASAPNGAEAIPVMVDEIKKQAESNQITQEEADEALQYINLSATNNFKIPDNISEEKRSEALEILNEKTVLEDALAQEEEKAKGIDPALLAPIQFNIDDIKSQIAERDNQLKSISELSIEKPVEIKKIIDNIDLAQSKLDELNLNPTRENRLERVNLEAQIDFYNDQAFTIENNKEIIYRKTEYGVEKEIDGKITPIDSPLKGIMLFEEAELNKPKGIKLESTLEKGKPLEVVSEKEYNNFVDKGIVTEKRLNDIANKVKEKSKLTEKENAIFTDKTGEINAILAQEVTTPLALTEEQQDKIAEIDAMLAEPDGLTEEEITNLKEEKNAIEISIKPITQGGEQGGIVQRKGTKERQPKAGERKGSTREAEKPKADNRNRPVSSEKKQEVVEVAEKVAEPVAEVVAEPTIEVEQYIPITEKQVSHEKFTKDNAVDYDYDYKTGENGREYEYISKIAVELITDDGDSIGNLIKNIDEEGNVTWNAEDLNGEELSEDGFDTKAEAQKGLVDKWNKIQKREFDKEAKRQAKAAEKEAAKKAKIAEKENPKGLAEKKQEVVEAPIPLSDIEVKYKSDPNSLNKKQFLDLLNQKRERLKRATLNLAKGKLTSEQVKIKKAAILSLENTIADIVNVINKSQGKKLKIAKKEDVAFSKKQYVIEDTESIVDEINKLEGVNIEVDPSESTLSKGKLDIKSIKNRKGLAKQPNIVTIADYKGIPIMVTISDELTTGDVVNPITGNKIDNLNGGNLFPYSKGNTGYAWAYTDTDTATDTLNVAKSIYNNNQELFDKLWADGKLPKNHIPVAVVKMGKSAMSSNEAVIRQIIDNLSDGVIPKENKVNAFNLLEGDIKNQLSVVQKRINKANGDPTPADMASSRGYKKILELLKTVKSFDELLKRSTELDIGTRPLLISRFTSGKADLIPSESKLTVKKDVAKALIGDLPKAEIKRINLGNLIDNLADKSLENVPDKHIISFVGIDISEDKPVIIKTHPNYPAALKGQGLGVLEETSHLASVMPAAYGNIVNKLLTAERKGKKVSGNEMVSAGLPAALNNVVLRNKPIGESPNDLNKIIGYLQLSFPKVQFFTDENTWGDVLDSENVKKFVKENEVVYGLTKDGHVYLNPEFSSLNTPIHEVGHIWIDLLENSNSALFNKGLDLVKGTKEFSDATEMYGDTLKAKKEALAILIGNRGESITDAAKKSKFKEWLVGLYKYIQEKFPSLKNLTPKQVENLTLEEFIDGALKDILGAKEVSFKASKKTKEVLFRKIKDETKKIELTDEQKSRKAIKESPLANDLTQYAYEGIKNKTIKSIDNFKAEIKKKFNLDFGRNTPTELTKIYDDAKVKFLGEKERVSMSFEDYLKDRNISYKQGKAEGRETSKAKMKISDEIFNTAIDYLKSKKIGIVKQNILKGLITKAAKVSSTKNLDLFINKVDSIMAKAEFIEKYITAQKIKKALSTKNKGNATQLIARLKTINLKYLSENDIDNFIDVSKQLLTSKPNMASLVDKINEVLSAEQTSLKEALDRTYNSLGAETADGGKFMNIKEIYQNLNKFVELNLINKDQATEVEVKYAKENLTKSLNKTYDNINEFIDSEQEIESLDDYLSLKRSIKAYNRVLNKINSILPDFKADPILLSEVEGRIEDELSEPIREEIAKFKESIVSDATDIAVDLKDYTLSKQFKEDADVSDDTFTLLSSDLSAFANSVTEDVLNEMSIEEIADFMFYSEQAMEGYVHPEIYDSYNKVATILFKNDITSDLAKVIEGDTAFAKDIKKMDSEYDGAKTKSDLSNIMTTHAKHNVDSFLGMGDVNLYYNNIYQPYGTALARKDFITAKNNTEFIKINNAVNKLKVSVKVKKGVFFGKVVGSLKTSDIGKVVGYDKSMQDVKHAIAILIQQLDYISNLPNAEKAKYKDYAGYVIENKNSFIKNAKSDDATKRIEDLMKDYEKAYDIIKRLDPSVGNENSILHTPEGVEKVINKLGGIDEVLGNYIKVFRKTIKSYESFTEINSIKKGEQYLAAINYAPRQYATGAIGKDITGKDFAESISKGSDAFQNLKKNSSATYSRVGDGLAPRIIDPERILQMHSNDVMMEYSLKGIIENSIDALKLAENKSKSEGEQRFLTACRDSISLMLQTEFIVGQSKGGDKLISTLLNTQNTLLVTNDIRQPSDYLSNLEKVATSEEGAKIMMKFVEEKFGKLTNTYDADYIEELNNRDKAAYEIATQLGGEFLWSEAEKTAGQTSASIQGQMIQGNKAIKTAWADRLIVAQTYLPLFIKNFEKISGTKFDANAYNENPQKYYLDNIREFTKARDEADLFIAKNLISKNPLSKAEYITLIPIINRWKIPRKDKWMRTIFNLTGYNNNDSEVIKALMVDIYKGNGNRNNKSVALAGRISRSVVSQMIYIATMDIAIGLITAGIETIGSAIGERDEEKLLDAKYFVEEYNQFKEQWLTGDAFTQDFLGAITTMSLGRFQNIARPIVALSLFFLKKSGQFSENKKENEAKYNTAIKAGRSANLFLNSYPTQYKIGMVAGVEAASAISGLSYLGGILSSNADIISDMANGKQFDKELGREAVAMQATQTLNLAVLLWNKNYNPRFAGNLNKVSQGFLYEIKAEQYKNRRKDIRKSNEDGFGKDD
jgi:hypothetical protein